VLHAASGGGDGGGGALFLLLLIERPALPALGAVADCVAEDCLLDVIQAVLTTTLDAVGT